MSSRPAVVRTELARTGAPTGELTTLGVGLLVGGAALVLRSRRLAVER